MKYINLFFLICLIFILNLVVSCGNNNNSNFIYNNIPLEVPNSSDGKELIDSDDVYYIALEKKLNDELDINRAPEKCAAQGLTKVVLNFITDEIQTCATYDLSKVSSTAYFSDKTDEVVTPTWSIYSGGGTLDGMIYTATNKPAIIVFKALYTENGISKLALFRLTVTGLISIMLNKTTDEIQLPATYDLSTELLVTSKLSNGTTKAVVKGDHNLLWTLASGAGTLADGVYTPSAKVETAVFNISYSENGVTKTAQFRLKVTGLSSLILSKSTDEINSCATYDLASKIVVSNKLSNGTINDVTASPNLTWTLSSGAGILEGKIYTAPAKAETAVFTASYTEAGITKTAQFRLKVTGLSSVVLDKTTDEIMLPATYDLASEIHATAKFSDGDSKSIDLIWALSSGAGNLSGSIYTPAPKTETAAFTGSYTENGVTKTAQFRLNVIGLSSLTLSKTTDEVVSCATYDLSQIVVSDKLSNGTINNVSNSITWKLVSGFGTLSDKIYMAPARAETAAFTANYTEAGITKTVQFRLKVIALASIKLSKATDEAQILAPYDLASNIFVTARLSNGQTKPLAGNDLNLRWTLSYGSGVLSGTLYTPSERIETAVLTATYTENGVAQSAQLRLKSTATLRGKIELVGLTLAQTTDSVRIGQTYDLSKLIAIAKFADKTTAEVSLSWIVSSGGGSISGVTYTAPNNVATVKLMGTFTALNGSAKSVNLTLTIYCKEIYGNRGIVTMAGAKFYLTNGMIVEIPQNSIEKTGEIYFTDLAKTDGLLPQQNKCTVNSSLGIKNVKIIIPIDQNQTSDDLSLSCFLYNSQKQYSYIINPLPVINDTNCIFNVDLRTNGSYSVPGQSNVLRAIDVTDDYIDGATLLSTNLKYNDPDIFNCVHNIKLKNGPDIAWPYYRQYFGSCWATTWLTLLKGYKKDLSANFESINNILNYTKSPLTDNEKILPTGKIESSTLYMPSVAKKIIGKSKDDIDAYFFPLLRDETIPSLTYKELGLNMKGHYINQPILLLSYLINNLNRGIPTMVQFTSHTILFVGYTYNGNRNITDIYNNAIFKYRNPAGDFAPDSYGSLWTLINESRYSQLRSYCIYYITQPPLTSPILPTVHLPEARPSITKPNPGDNKCIRFMSRSSQKIAWTSWDCFSLIVDFAPVLVPFADADYYLINSRELLNFSPLKQISTYAHKWINTDNNQVNDFENIEMLNMPIYGIASPGIAVNFYKGEALASNLKIKTIVNNSSAPSANEYNFSNFKVKETDTIVNVGVKFRREFKEPADITMRIALVDSQDSDGIDLSNSNNYYDKFDLKFTYIPPPPSKLELNADKISLEESETSNITATLNGIVLQYSQLVWNYFLNLTKILYDFSSYFWPFPSLNSPIAYSLDTPFTGVFVAPSEPGKYTIQAAYGDEIATCEITVLKLEMTNEVQTDMNPDDIISFKVKITGVTRAKQIELESVNGEYTLARQALDEIGHTMTFEYALKLKDSVKATAKDITVDARIINFPVTRTTQSKINILRKELKIAPAYTELKMQQQLQFTALLNDATIETGILWSTESAGGTINSSGSYTAPVKPGTYLVTAKYEDVEATAEVRVIPSDFKIAPKQTTLIYGQQQQFSATVDNLSVDTNLTWSVEDANGGSITSAGQYAAPNSVGTYMVKVLYYGELEATAEVTVQAPVLQITPSTKTLYTNETQNFTLLVNNTTQEAEIQWTSTGGGIGNDGSYMAPDHAGTYIVTATFRTVEATAEVIVKEHEIKLTPLSAEMNIGQQVQFTAFVDNATAETGVSWSTDVMGGTVTQTGLYTAPSLPGVHRVTAKYQGAETSAEVTVNSLFLTPLTYQMRTDQTVQFDLKYGTNEDTTNEVTAQALWKVVPEVGSVSSGLYTPAAVGNYKVTAEYAGMILTAEVTVTAADLKITPPSIVLNRSQQMTFKALVGDTTQETGISWSVVSPSGGSITQAGVYTAPTQWGKYVIKAAYLGIEATAEVRVNDERVQLAKDNVFLNVWGNPMKADGTPLNINSGNTPFNVRVSGQDVSTVEISIAEGENLGRFVYSSRTYPVSGYPVNVTYSYYFYYTKNPTQTYYDTNEIIHLNVKCPENSNASIVIPVTIYQPQLSGTQEVISNAGTYDERKWQFKSIGYRAQNGTWSNANYKNSYYMVHGLYLGIWSKSNMTGYVQNYYCGEPTGEHRTYYNNPSDARHGLLTSKSIYAANFLSYDFSGWNYYSEQRGVNGQWVIVNCTEKVVEKYVRSSIIQNWSSDKLVPGSRIITKYDGWSAQ